MKRIVGARRDHAIDRDEVLHRRDLGRQDDAVAGKPDLLGARRRQQRRLDHRLAHHRAGVDRRGARGVLVHQMGQQFLVERAPVGADPHRLAMPDRHFDDLRELPVALVLEADIAGIDPVFVERLGAGGMLGEQFVADIVEVADQRDRHAHPREPVADMRHGGGGLVAVDRDAHEFGAGAGERGDLARGALDVGGVGVGHGLDDDRGAAADHHRRGAGADAHADAASARFGPDAGFAFRHTHGILACSRGAPDRTPRRIAPGTFLLHRPVIVISLDLAAGRRKIVAEEASALARGCAARRNGVTV